MDKKRNSKVKLPASTGFKIPGALQPVCSVLRRLTTWAGSRKGAPIVIGICLGIIITDSFQPKCSVAERKTPDAQSAVVGQTIQDLPPIVLPAPLSLGNEDYEPAVLIDGNKKIPPSVQNAKRPVRPRYYSSELGIHETLFVAISSSSRTLPTLGVAINKTTAHYLPRLSFFISSVSRSEWSAFQNFTMNIIRSPEVGTDQMHPMFILRHITTTHLQTFDWFFLVPDSSYIRGRELLEFVKKISVGRPVYMGTPLANSEAGYCDFAAGILLSQAVLMGISENLAWCMEFAVLDDFSASVGTCVSHIFDLRCETAVQASELVSFRINEPKSLDSQDTTSELVDSEKILPLAVAIYPLSDPAHFYRLHLELSHRKIGEIEQAVEDLQEDIVKQSPYTPGGGADLHWPIGVNSPAVPNNRFDVIEWTHFNETHLFRPDDFRVAVPLGGSYLKSIQQVVDFSRNTIEERYAKLDTKIVGDIRVANGYVRFDPTRGIEYLLDMSYQTDTSGRREQVIKKLRLLRALGQMEQIFLPFVTENSRVHLTISLTPSDIPLALEFLRTFTKVHLEAQDNIYLLLVLVYGKGDPGKESPRDVFLKIKSEAQEVEKRYSKSLGTRIGLLTIKNPLTTFPSEFAIMDLVSRKLNKDKIIFRCNLNFVPSVDLLNRVRLTTIPGTQAYFPIPFVQYKPSLIYKTQPYPVDFEIKRLFGHYDRDSVDFAAFFMGDYTVARRNEAENWPIVTADRDLPREYPRPNQAGQVYDLYTLFLSTNLHVFRGVEPALKVKFTMLHCDKDPQLDKRLWERCQTRLLNSLAGKQQLAVFMAHQDRTIENSSAITASDRNNVDLTTLQPIEHVSSVKTASPKQFAKRSVIAKNP